MEDDKIYWSGSDRLMAYWNDWELGSPSRGMSAPYECLYTASETFIFPHAVKKKGFRQFLSISLARRGFWVFSNHLSLLDLTRTH